MFEAGYDDKWVLQDIMKDHLYQSTFVGMGLGLVRDAQARRLLERVQADIGQHYERLASLTSERSPREFPGAPTESVPGTPAVQAAPGLPPGIQGTAAEGSPGVPQQQTMSYQGDLPARSDYRSRGRRPDSSRAESYRPVGSEDGPERGWSSSIPQGRGAYRGTTQEYGHGNPVEGSFYQTGTEGQDRSPGYQSAVSWEQSSSGLAGQRAVPRYRRDDET